MVRLRLVLHALVLTATLGATPAARADDARGAAFFEAKIRPVLVKECFSCHASGAKKFKGGLRVDTREGLRDGGATGPAIVPGKPEESLLMEALRHDGLAMPPKKKLPDQVAADFERWIKMGAPDPRDANAVAKTSGIDIEAGRAFWAYRPPRPEPAPSVRDASWPRGAIDRFVLAGLEAKGLRPVPDADRTTLARRLAFDLTGLPLEPSAVRAFVNDHTPDAYERLVDRLLASPRFGERWGRRWLDLARFAESLTLRGFVLPNAWRYRDYVIDAFNADMPYDQFLREQIAGDLLPAGTLADRRRQRIATTFLALGNTNLEDQDKAQLEMDFVDEQLDTIGKVVLAQTIGCARCHDHKFDPIPTKDYYALAGILKNTRALEHANVSKWLEFPLPLPDEQESALARQESEIAALKRSVDREKARLTALGKAAAIPGKMAAKDAPGVLVDDSQARVVGAWTRSTSTGTYIDTGYLHDGNIGKGEKTLTFQPELAESGVYEVWLAYSPAGSRAKDVPITILSAEGETTRKVDMRLAPPIDGRFVSLGRYRFERNGQAYVMISNDDTAGFVTADAVCFVPESAAARRSLQVDGSAGSLAMLENALKRRIAALPARPLVMSIAEADPSTIADIRIHLRGSVQTLGEPAPRGFLQVATIGEPPKIPTTESGRRELADWLADARNPLTARVYVNRVWGALFGVGLVPSVDNFGTTGDRPSHPELLDALALEFMNEDGWSTKRLVRRIVLSRTYRLATSDDSHARAVDPENHGLWRQNSKRLEAECLRDAMLWVAGTLQEDMGGPSFPAKLAADYGYAGESNRRSVYVPVFRNALPEIFEVFDFADPSMVVGRRNTSTVTPQALFLMNHPFPRDCARAAARRVRAESGDRLNLAYHLSLGRGPSPSERAVAQAFLQANDSEESWALLFQALFSSIDFREIH